MALHRLHPEIMEDLREVGNFKYPKPISAPPTPSTSRATSPTSSRLGSEDEDEEDDEDPDQDSINSDIERDILSMKDE